MASVLALAERLTAALRALVAAAVVIFYGYMAVAVLIQVLGRYVFNYSIDWATETATFAQIWMVLLAAGIAMRRRLHVGVDLLVSTFPVWLGRIITLLIAIACLWFLAVAAWGSLRLIQIGFIQTSPALAIPMWLPYLSLPVGLCYFAFEFLLAMARRWRYPPGSLDLEAAAVRESEAGMTALTLLLFLFLILAGTPIVFALGVAAGLTLWLSDVPMSIVAQRIYAGLDSFTIMAIPFFVFAGIIMERGGIARRIIDFASALVGWITGSLLLVAVVAGTGLAAISGSGSADTAATSSIMLPEMRRRGYDIDFAAGIMAASGSLGPIIPPSIMMVVLATISNISVGGMFLGGILPGLLMAAGLLLACYIHARRSGRAYTDTEPFTLSRLGRTLVAALPAFSMPVIIVGGIVGGVFTPTEAASVAVFIGLIVGLFVYREIKLRDLPKLMLRAAAVSAAVMMIIATASIFSWLIASQNIPALLGERLRLIADSPYAFLIIVNLLLLLIGMFMESISAILILTPVLMPIAISFGIDPLHFGVIIVMNLSIGMITPPYGITLFVASSIAGRSITQVSARNWMPLGFMLATLLAATYFPALVTLLPETFMR